jgi:hypothetical protein
MARRKRVEAPSQSSNQTARPGPTTQQAKTSETSNPPMSELAESPNLHKYAVALSFSGTDRRFAELIASGLTAHGVKVFYDRFEEHELWGRDLFNALRNVYVKECRYCVVLITDEYLSRMWPQFERQQIIERLATEHGQDAVLPVRLDGCQTEVPGLSRGIGYLSVTSAQATRVIEMLLKKLGQPGYELDTTDAYNRALSLIKTRRDGCIPVDRFFTSPEVINKVFKRVLSGEILHWEGHEFYWSREKGSPLILYGRNDALTRHKDRGLVEVCRFDAPESWIGCGRWTLNWPDDGTKEQRKEKGEESTELLIVLYLVSPNPIELDDVTLPDPDFPAPFMAAIYLKPDNSQLFYSVSAQYDDLR